MADELQWAGAWRKKGAGDGMGMVSGIKVGVGAGPSAVPGLGESAPRAPASTGSGKVEGAAISAEQLKPKETGEPVRSNGRARLNRQ